MPQVTEHLTARVEVQHTRTWSAFVWAGRLLELFGVELSYGVVCWFARRSLQMRVDGGTWQWVDVRPREGE